MVGWMGPVAFWIKNKRDCWQPPPEGAQCIFDVGGGNWRTWRKPTHCVSSHPCSSQGDVILTAACSDQRIGSTGSYGCVFGLTWCALNGYNFLKTLVTCRWVTTQLPCLCKDLSVKNTFISLNVFYLLELAKALMHIKWNKKHFLNEPVVNIKPVLSPVSGHTCLYR